MIYYAHSLQCVLTIFSFALSLSSWNWQWQRKSAREKRKADTFLSGLGIKRKASLSASFHLHIPAHHQMIFGKIFFLFSASKKKHIFLINCFLLLLMLSSLSLLLLLLLLLPFVRKKKKMEKLSYHEVHFVLKMIKILSSIYCQNCFFIYLRRRRHSLIHTHSLFWRCEYLFSNKRWLSCKCSHVIWIYFSHMQLSAFAILPFFSTRMKTFFIFLFNCF